jgi:TonB family protein
MSSSAMASMDDKLDGFLGEDVSPNESNMVDVILAGGGGSIKKGDAKQSDRCGRCPADGDRMAEVNGIGLGTGGRAGFGTGAAVRAKVAVPKATDIELGGEAGSRSPESILRVIRSHMGGFRYSYEKFLRANPKLGGKISLKFTIAPSGDIVAISIVKSATGSAALDQEIMEKAKRMKFDQIEKGNVTITYTLTLDKN